MNIQFKSIDHIAEIRADDWVFTDSDSNCLALLMHAEFGVIPEKPGADTGSAFFETPTHYCMINRSYGFRDQRDNGYTGILIPKSQAARDDAASFFAEFLHELQQADPQTA